MAALDMCSPGERRQQGSAWAAEASSNHRAAKAPGGAVGRAPTGVMFSERPRMAEKEASKVHACGNESGFSCHTYRMRSSLYLTVEQARAVNSFSPGAWLLRQTPEGWLAMRGDATLIGTNTRRPRVFKSLDKAVCRLRAEVGAKDFRVETEMI